MTAAADLYRALVLDHGKHPRNVGRLAAATHAADGDNPLCGDVVRVEAEVVGDGVVALRFSGESCVLATASASLMTERVVGMRRGEVARAIAAIEARCAGNEAPRAGSAVRRATDAALVGGTPSNLVGGTPPNLDDVLQAFADVHRHRVRIACATLPWRTLGRALGD